jgi:hypothetical protein
MVTFPYWYQAWLERERGKGNSPPQLHFCNFIGDDNFGHYLQVAAAFGVRWAVIADGNSFQPKSDVPSATLIGYQIAEVMKHYQAWRVSDDQSSPVCQSGQSSDKHWFSYWQNVLQDVNVFTLANCWKKKDSRTEACAADECNNSRKIISGSCNTPDWHTNHIESFEDFAEYDEELSDIYARIKEEGGKPNVGRCLLEEHPECPSSIAMLFADLVASLVGSGE